MSRTTYTIALLGFLAIKVKGDKIIGVSTGNGNPVYQGNYGSRNPSYVVFKRF